MCAYTRTREDGEFQIFHYKKIRLLVVSEIFLKTWGFFLKTRDVFFKTRDFFFKTRDFFSKTRDFFSKTRDFFWEKY